MENSYKEILNILRKIRVRLLIKNIIRNLFLGASLALGLGVLVVLTSRIIPIYNVYGRWWYVFILITTAALVYSFATIPNEGSAAAKADSLGLKERVSTSLEIIKEDSIYKDVLIEDTLKNLSSLKYKQHISVVPQRKFLILIPILTVFFIGLNFIPNPLKDVAKKKQELSVYKKEEAKKIEKAKEEVEENNKLTEEQKKELIAKLNELKLQIKNAEEKKEVEKSFEKTTKKLELIKKTKLSEDLKKAAEELLKNEATKKIAEAMKNIDKEKLKEELEKLKDSLNSMDDSKKNSLKDALSKAANSVSNEGLKQQLNSLSSSLSSSDKEAISKYVDSVSGTLSEAMSEEAANETIAQLQEQLQQGSSTQQQSASAGQGTAQGQGQGQGQGAGQGSGQGQSGNGAGGGAGSGSSNGNGGVTGASGGIGSKAPGSGEKKEYEKIFTPHRLGGEGETSKLTGKNNNSGSSESTLSSDPNAALGELKPYNQVSGEYVERAMENLDDYQIPEAMLEIIKDYFSSLEM